MDFGQIVAPTIKELFIERIEGMILSGALKPGDRLPSERDLAEQMQHKQDHCAHRSGRPGPHGLPGGHAAAGHGGGRLRRDRATWRRSTPYCAITAASWTGRWSVCIIELRSAVEGGALYRGSGRRHTQAGHGLSCARMLDEYAETGQAATRTVKTMADALARFHYRICTLSGNQLFPLIMNAFRGVGSTLLWQDSARFWGPEALLEQGNQLLFNAGRGRRGEGGRLP